MTIIRKGPSGPPANVEGLRTVDNYAQAASTKDEISIGESLYVSGRVVPGDGGSGVFVKTLTSEGDDGGTIIGSGEGSAMVRIIDDVISCVWYGADGEGGSSAASINTAAINTALVKGRDSGRNVYLPSGTYWIDDTLNLTECYSVEFFGDGMRTNSGTQINWAGPSDRPVIDLIDCQFSTVSRMRVTTLTGFPAEVGLRIRRSASATILPTANRVRRFWVSGLSAAEPNMGQCLRIDRESGAPDTNNENHSFEDVWCTNYGTAGGAYSEPCGAYLEPSHKQSKDHQFIRCYFLAAFDSLVGCGFRGHNTVYFEKCGFGSNERCFQFDELTGPFTAVSCYSERDNQFLWTPNSANPAIFNIINCDYGGGSRVSPYSIEFKCGGSMTISGGLWENEPGKILAGSTLDKNTLHVTGAYWVANLGAGDPDDTWPVVQNQAGSVVSWIGNSRKLSGPGTGPWKDRIVVPETTTANRPTDGLFSGLQWFDTTLGKPIWYDGTNWVDATGAVV